MSQADLATQRSIPAHVPKELIFDIDLDTETEATKRNPFERWMQLREAPDLFYAPPKGEEGGGYWVVKSADYVREVLQNPDPFSSCMAAGGGAKAWPRKLIPLELDPPEHIKYRGLLAGIFSPRAIDEMLGTIENLAGELIDKFADRGSCDFMTEFARPFPVTVFSQMMGLPVDERPKFMAWEHQMFQGETPELKREAGINVALYLSDLIKRKREKPADDIVSRLVKAEIDGKPMPQDRLEDMCFLLYLAGLDTVTGGLGHTFRYLAEHPELQEELRADPDKITDTVEELLRIHAWINISRTIIHDTEFHGTEMKAGERIRCMIFNASRDPKLFEDADKVHLDRSPNPHFAFAAGVHRCLGSHLARREIRMAVRLMTSRLPTFRIKRGADLKYDGGLVALSSLPIEW